MCPRTERVLAHPGGELILGDALEWLAALPAGSVDLVIADGPYGIAKAPWDRVKRRGAFVDWSLDWIRAAHRVLSPTTLWSNCASADAPRRCASATGPLWEHTFEEP